MENGNRISNLRGTHREHVSGTSCSPRQRGERQFGLRLLGYAFPSGRQEAFAWKAQGWGRWVFWPHRGRINTDKSRTEKEMEAGSRI